MAEQNTSNNVNQAIGEVQAATGQVVAIGADGTQRVLAVGDPVFPGDEIRTLGVSSVVIAMQDGTRFDLGRDGQAVLDETVYSKDIEAVRTAAQAEVAELQTAIAEGADPGEVTDPPAAGNEGNTGLSESAQLADSGVPRIGNVGVVEAGFETTGVQNVVSPLVDDVTGLGTDALTAAALIAAGGAGAGAEPGGSTGGDTGGVVTDPSGTDGGGTGEGGAGEGGTGDGNTGAPPANVAPFVGSVDLGEIEEDSDPIVFSEADLLANTTDPDTPAEDLTVTSVALSDPAAGTLTDNGNGTWTYTPAADFSGEDVRIEFVVSDGEASGDGAAFVFVRSVNDAPTIDGGSLIVDEGTVGTPLGLSAPTDVDGDEMTITVTALPSFGVIRLADGTPVTDVSFLTPAQFAGLQYDAPDEVGAGGSTIFGYEVNDGQGQVNSVVASSTIIQVDPVNDAPVANADAVVLDIDTASVASGNVLANDADPDGPVLEVANPGVYTGTYGTLELSTDGSYLYTVDPDKVAAEIGGRSDGLVGHWTFDAAISGGTEIEDSAPEGTSTPLSLNGATLETDPVYGSVVSLDGSGGMRIPDNTDINTGGPFPERTLSLRFKADDTAGRQVLYEEGQGWRGLNIYIEDGELFAGGWNLRESGWLGDWVNLGPVNANEWNHVTLVLDGGPTVQPDSLTAYLNGVAGGSVPGSQLWGHSGDITVGATDGATRYDGGAASSASNAFSGQLDDLRVYDVALDANEVQQLADAPLATLTDTFTYTATDGIEDAAPGELTVVVGPFDAIQSPASGDGILVGTDGNDIFQWQASDAGTPGAPATDTIENFGESGKDVLDIADLLVDGASGDLTDYLHFDQDGSGNTVVHISSTAGFAGGYDPSAEDQTIVIENFSVSGSDADIIASLVADNTLITG